MDEAERKRLSRAGSSGVSDAMERLDLPRAVLTGFNLTAAEAVVAGPAFTLRQVPKHPSTPRGERLVRHGEVAERASPGDVAVIDAGGRRDIAAWGQNHSTRCQARGLAGALIHGATRDTAGIRRLGFAVFHLGASPVASRWDMETAEIGGAVVVAGVTIRAGDILVGDGDGLVVIARDTLPAVLAELRE